MKPQFWPTLIALLSIVALAAEEAPPAELLQNLDFYQNMTMVQNKDFFDVATEKLEPVPLTVKKETPVADSTTIHSREKSDASK
jgi:hypothetical protein